MYIPEKYYVGFQSQGDDSLVGFFTPDDDDAASKKRKVTVDSWSDTKLRSQATTITNEPRTGFRIVDTARRYRSNNVLFRVIHPSVGAEFEISAENLNTLHQQCIIEYGEIKNELLFVRNGQTNILVVKDSEEHKKAIVAMQQDKKKKEEISKINKKDITPGTVLNISSLYGKVIYLGKHKVSYITQNDGTNQYTYASYNRNFIVQTTDDNYHVFLDGGTIHLRKTWPKITKVYPDKEEYIIEDVCEKITRVAYSLEYITVDGIEFDKEINPNDYEIVFINHEHNNMNNINNWNDHYSNYVLWDDGTYSQVFPRIKYINKISTLVAEFTGTYKIDGLNISPVRNNLFSYSTDYITDPTTIIYSRKVVKKDKK